MTIWQRIAREPNAILGLVVAVYGVLVAFHVLELDRQQIGALVALGGAAVVALRWLVTPAREVVARRRPSGHLEAGPASVIPTGSPVDVTGTWQEPV